MWQHLSSRRILRRVDTFSFGTCLPTSQVLGCPIKVLASLTCLNKMANVDTDTSLEWKFWTMQKIRPQIFPFKILKILKNYGISDLHFFTNFYPSPNFSNVKIHPIHSGFGNFVKFRKIHKPTGLNYRAKWTNLTSYEKLRELLQWKLVSFEPLKKYCQVFAKKTYR